jgi:hypothetical protein
LRAAEADHFIDVNEEIEPAYNAFKKAFKERIYKREDYVRGFNAYKAAFTTFAEKAVPVYAQYERIWGELPLPAPFIMNGTSYGYEDYWGLHVPEKYIIQLSLYGSNGEYVAAYPLIQINGEWVPFLIEDTVFITVSKTGHKGYLSPIELIIHETGHQALENVDFLLFGTTERLCERFITHLFGRTIIPNYRVTIPSSYPYR